jgi:hypothetical protein
MIMKRIIIALATICSAMAQPLVAQTTKSVTSSLVGVWRVTEYQDSTKAPWKPNTPPSQFVFTKSHYSLVWYDTLPDLAGRDLTASDKATLWDAFFAHAGTYEMHGDRVVFHPIVAKNPTVMKNKCTIELQLKPDKGTFLGHVISMCGDVSNTTDRFRMTRAE